MIKIKISHDSPCTVKPFVEAIYQTALKNGLATQSKRKRRDLESGKRYDREYIEIIEK